MSSAFWGTPLLLLLFTGCYPGADWGSDEVPGEPYNTVRGYQKLRTTRQAGSAPATVQAAVQLSDAAVAGFEALALVVNVYSAESLEGQGLRAQWLGEPGGEPVRAPFAGEWSTNWSATLYLGSSPCAAAPCVLNLELAPEGEWRSELVFLMEYELSARLDVRSRDPGIYSSLKLGLQESP